MKRLMIAACISSFLFSCTSEQKTDAVAETKTDTTAHTDSKPAAEEWVPIDSATAMKTMMEVGTPGEEHKMLAKSDGNYTAESTMWMAPGAPPVIGKGTSTNKMIMGGRQTVKKL